MTENSMESRTLPVCFSLVRIGLRPVPSDETGDATHLSPQRHGRAYPKTTMAARGAYVGSNIKIFRTEML